ncbi:MAG: hypothetical protein BGO95_11705 [Micrococcales bacterium 73-13]|nr:MAG: hypothetical protein BGO95_11705 [Micrococcales bacterium 73-13]
MSFPTTLGCQPPFDCGVNAMLYPKSAVARRATVSFGRLTSSGLMARLLELLPHVAIVRSIEHFFDSDTPSTLEG